MNKWYSLQSFNIVGWATGRALACEKLDVDGDDLIAALHVL